MVDNGVTMTLVEHINSLIDRADENCIALKELTAALEMVVRNHKTLWREHQELQARVAQLENAQRNKRWFQWR